MEHDTGREPTDAELLFELARLVGLEETGVEEGNAALDALIARGHEYLSGARPMPPAPDEVAQQRLDGSICSAQEQAGDGPCGNCPRCTIESITAGLGHQIETLNQRVAKLETLMREVVNGFQGC